MTDRCFPFIEKDDPLAELSAAARTDSMLLPKSSGVYSPTSSSTGDPYVR